MASKEYELKKSNFDKSKLVDVRRVTLPLWKWKNDEERFFTILTPIKVGKILKSKSGDADLGKKAEKEKEPAHLAEVINLETGARCQLIFGKVLATELEEAYPKAGYVDKSFRVTQSKIEGKDYNGYSITEIRVK